ncbi:hypothetical protein CHS0354_009191 [Potamilus streckersoni]|uniref:Uncharacterized protein n=1 Tax=Potamilus streckersoni TaxID=2493646 RepID=A0AAE0W5A6_9BIVA|nr:hypothetical protein CHS0354_009191 [Potamilus streckersoni]
MPIKRVLSDKEIADIKSMKNKTTINDIADKYKIGYHRIYKIFNEPDDEPIEEPIEEPVIEEPIVDDPVIDDPVITAIKQLGEQLAEIKVAVCYLVDNKLDKLLNSELVKAVGQHSRDINGIVDILQLILEPKVLEPKVLQAFLTGFLPDSYYSFFYFYLYNMPCKRYLTQDDIDEINYLRGKMPVSSIADHFKISLNRIYKVFSGEERPTEFYTFRDQQQGEALKKLNEEIARSSRNACVGNACVSDENKELKLAFENLKSEIIEAVKPAVETQVIPTQVIPAQAPQQIPRWLKNHYKMYPPDEKVIILPVEEEEEKEFNSLMEEVEEINKFGKKLCKKL